MSSNITLLNGNPNLLSLENIRIISSLVYQGASLFPKKNIQDLLFKTAGAVLSGTYVWVAKNALQGFSSKIEVEKQPIESPTISRLQKMAQLMIASSAGALFICSQQAGDKVRSAIQLIGIATGLGIAWKENKRELDAANEKVRKSLSLEVHDIALLHEQLRRVQNIPQRSEIPITYSSKNYADKKAQLIAQIETHLAQITKDSWDANDPALQDLRETLEKVRNYQEGTVVDMPKSIQGKSFEKKIEQYTQKLKDLIANQGRINDPDQKARNLKDLNKLQEKVKSFTATTGVPNTIVYGRDELPTSIFYGEKGSLPQFVSFRKQDYPINYPSQDYDEQQKFAIQHIQSYIDAVASESLDPSTQMMATLQKKRDEVASITKESQLPASIEIPNSQQPGKCFSIPVDYTQVVYSFTDTNQDKHVVAIPVDYIHTYQFIDSERLLYYTFTNIHKQEQEAVFEIDYPTDSMFEIKKRILFDTLTKQIDFIDQAKKTEINQDIKKAYTTPTNQVFNQRNTFAIALAAVSTLIVLGQTFTKTHLSSFAYSTNITLGAKLSWSIGSLLVAFTENARNASKKAEIAREQEKTQQREQKNHKVVAKAHIEQAEAILAQRKLDLKKCQDKIKDLQSKLLDSNYNRIVTEKETNKFSFPLRSLGVTHITIEGKGELKYQKLLEETTRLLEQLQPLTEESVQGIASKQVLLDQQEVVDKAHLLDQATQWRRAQAVAFAFSGVLQVLDKAFPKTNYLGALAKVASAATILGGLGAVASETPKLATLGESHLSPVSLFWERS